MPSALPGRNEPCHCGSGRKYKKCCLDEDAAAASAALRLPSLDRTERALTRATALLGSQNVSAVNEALVPLAALLLEDPRLARLRFPPVAFSELLERELANRPADRGFAEIAARIVACLPTKKLLADLEKALVELLRPSRLEDPQLLAVAIAYLLLEFEQAADQSEPEPWSVAEMLVRAQATEWFARRGELDRVLGTFPAQEGNLDLQAVRAFASDHEGDVSRLMESTPGLLEALEREQNELRAAAMEALLGPTPPPLVAADEYLWLVIRGGTALRGQGDSRKETPSASFDLLAAVMNNEFRDGISARLLRDLPTDKQRTESEELRASLAVAWLADPGRLAACVLTNKKSRFMERDPAEEALVGAALGKRDRASFEGWASWLAERGDHAAAARVRTLAPAASALLPQD